VDPQADPRRSRAPLGIPKRMTTSSTSPVNNQCFGSTSDAKNHCAAASSPLSPVSTVKMKTLPKPGAPSKPSTSNTSDTGDVWQKSPEPESGGGRYFSTVNPMNQDRVMTQLANLRAAPRCGARTRAGGACQCPAIVDRKRCRLRGGRSPGAPKGPDNGNYRDGTFTTDAIQERQWLRSVVRSFAKVGK
jgi:hypothetical protein